MQNRRSVRTALCATFLLTVTACATTQTPSGEVDDRDRANDARTYRPGDSGLVFEGRWKIGDEAECGWSGCAVRLTATATTAVATVRGPAKLLYTVEVDGIATAVGVQPNAQGDIVLWTGEVPQTHTVRLIRQNEGFFGPNAFLELRTTGQVGDAVTAPLARRIEFVGDSIAVGYGILGDAPTCSFTAAKQSAWHAWTMQVARAFDAEASIVAWSGIGVLGPATEGKTDTIHVYYDRAVLLDDTSAITSDKPTDLVAVNLSTNDFTVDGNPDQSTFVDAYVALLEQVRAMHPKAVIAIGKSPMLSDEYPQGLNQGTLSTTSLRAAMATFAAKHPDARLVFVDHAALNPLGCDYHPNADQSAAVAQEFVDVIRPVMDW